MGVTMGAFSVTLPYPPTINHYWKTFQREAGQPIEYALTPKGKRFRRLVQQYIMLARTQARSEGVELPIPGPVCVSAFVYPPDLRKRDLDNILKPLLDSLQHSGVVKDDADISTLLVKRCARDRSGGKVHVTVNKIL